MPQLKENAFTFESKALPKDTFSVVRFSGEEGLSTLYRFEILLISEQQDIDLAAVLQNPATFTIKGLFAHGPDLPFHGILSTFEQMHQFGPYTFYRTELRPRLWWLTLTHHNQVFLDKKIDQFLGAVLKDGGLSHGMDFEFRLQGHYDPREYVCQYGESHFDFVSRWMEREGIYYWFEQGGDAEKMLASDTHIAHAALPGHETFVYSPPSGLDTLEAGKVIQRFTLQQSPMPKSVLLKDYNYMKPSLQLEGKAPVQAQGRGEIYFYGEHFPDRDEGQRLAKVRAEAYLCREKRFHGHSLIPAVRPGYLFTLQRHYSQVFNTQYLTTGVQHEGSQERYLVSGLSLGGLESPDGLFYRNSFTCIPGTTQFRPERATPRPRIAGSLSARIDAAGSGQYAELDEHGRYKVILPFDMSGRKDGKASAWVRMMQSYAGQGMGFHAPLHKGTEVLLSFIEADPDRPVIAGAIPNPETPSPVNDTNQTQTRLVSGSGNVIHMEDQAGSERILMHSPTHNSFGRIGAHNDPGGEPSQEDDGIRWSTEGTWSLKAFLSNEIILGKKMETVVGPGLDIKLVEATGITAGLKTELVLGGEGSYHFPHHWVLKGSEQKAAAEKLEAIESDQRAVGTKVDALGSYDTVRGTWTSVSAEISQAVADKMDVGAAITEAKGEVTRALTTQINAVGERTDALGQKVEALGTRVEAAGTMLADAGMQLANAGSRVTNAGSDIKNAGSSIMDAGFIMRDSPIIMDN